jgi:tetratricopeptide (TPR) repeat protein
MKGDKIIMPKTIYKPQPSPSQSHLKTIHEIMRDEIQENGRSIPKWMEKDMVKSEKDFARQEAAQAIADYKKETGDLKDLKKEIKQLRKNINEELLIATRNGFSEENKQHISDIVEEICKKSEKAIDMQNKLLESKPAFMDILRTSAAGRMIGSAVNTTGKTLNSVGTSVGEQKDNVVDFVENKYKDISECFGTQMNNGMSALKKIKGKIAEANENFKKGIETAYDNAVDSVMDVAKTVGKGLDAAGNMIAGGAKSLYTSTTKTVGNAGKAIAGVGVAAGGAVVGAGVKAVNGAKSLYDGGKKLAHNAYDSVTTMAQNAGSAVTTMAQNAYDDVISGVDKAHTKFLEISYAAENKLSQHLNDMETHLESKYSRNAEIRGAFKNLCRAIFGKDQQAIDSNERTKFETTGLNLVAAGKTGLDQLMTRTENALQQKQSVRATIIDETKFNDFKQTLSYEKDSDVLQGAGMIPVSTTLNGMDILSKFDLTGETFEYLDMDSDPKKRVFFTKSDKDGMANIVFTGFEGMDSKKVHDAVFNSISDALCHDDFSVGTPKALTAGEAMRAFQSQNKSLTIIDVIPQVDSKSAVLDEKLCDMNRGREDNDICASM